MLTWMAKSKIIVSNNFTKSELIKFYPQNKDKVNVIPLSYYSQEKKN